MSRPRRPGPHELGQNFLTDRRTIARIVRLAGQTSGPLVEWGAGDGSVTLPLSQARPAARGGRDRRRPGAEPPPPGRPARVHLRRRHPASRAAGRVDRGEQRPLLPDHAGAPAPALQPGLGPSGTARPVGGRQEAGRRRRDDPAHGPVVAVAQLHPRPAGSRLGFPPSSVGGRRDPRGGPARTSPAGHPAPAWLPTLGAAGLHRRRSRTPRHPRPNGAPDAYRRQSSSAVSRGSTHIPCPATSPSSTGCRPSSRQRRSG